ncbi:cell division protein FtsZ [Thermotomaculum hydrothermale]|uniref:Cell division protein FtsZ n=1 Tax=Thermotomaculum hydrothermale TaxID=981385 RepID=A0A7R6PPA6_9BACT|nr:cell division protein FtsZ [Thermotomaculum hydrothermale]BBB32796.1 cell division protein FtsZ [Thermotomaculum hydrothermale]
MTPEFIIEEAETLFPKIKVIGVGGGGCNTINRMIESNIQNVEFIAVNTDYQSLLTSKAKVKIQIGKNLTQGLGAGSNPEIARQAALEDKDKLKSIISGAHMLFITAGLGGGTGTGAAPVIAEIAKELGILSVAIVTQPFYSERTFRYKNFLRGFNELKEHVDSMIILKNDKIKEIFDPNVPISTAYREIDSVLEKALRGIVDMLFKPGVENIDFADVKTIFEYKGFALLGLGKASGSDRAILAFEEARQSPLLETYPLAQAKGLIMNITYGTGDNELTLKEHDAILKAAHDALGTNVNVNFIKGMVQDEEVGDELRITIIATGYDYSSFKPLPEEELSKMIDHSFIDDSFVLKSNDLQMDDNSEEELLDDGSDESLILTGTMPEIDNSDFESPSVSSISKNSSKRYESVNYPLKEIAESFIKNSNIPFPFSMDGGTDTTHLDNLKNVPAFVRAYIKLQEEFKERDYV